MDITRINPSPRWSDATIFNGMAHFVEVADDATGDIESQIAQVFAQAEASLLTVNSDISRLISVTIYLTDFAHLQFSTKHGNNGCLRGVRQVVRV